MTRAVRPRPDPVITVVMPVYNGAALLPATLDSLAAQSFIDFEVIVVDDCSTDATRACVAGWSDPRVRLVAMPVNGGPVLARNAGVAAARGRYIAALDADDLCRPDRFARQVAYLEANPATVLLGTAADLLVDGAIRSSEHAAITTPMLIDWLTGIENPLIWSSVMIRGDAARRLDPFMRPEWLYAEDFDLYQRIRRFGAIARLDEPLMVYRVHAGGVSKRFTERMETVAAAILAERHADLFGEQVDRIAALIVAHILARRAVRDRAALTALGSALGAIQADFLARHHCSREDRRLIRWETARRWRGVGRAGLRAGTLGVADLLAARPAHLGLGYAGLPALLWSGAIGGVRRAIHQPARAS